MNLSQLVARLGLAELARRLGITPATLRRWVNVGPPSRGVDLLRQIAARSERSRRAAATLRTRRVAAFQAGISPPEAAHRLPGDLEPEEVIPQGPPRRSDARGDGEVQVYREGIHALKSDRYKGEVYSYTVGKPAANVDADEIANIAIRDWQKTGRTFCRLVFLFFRFIPFNPIYRGEMIKKQGKWHDWWTSTEALSSLRSISNSIINVFAGYRDTGNKWVKGAHEAARERVIWLEQFQVHLFDDNEGPPDLRTVMRRRLR